MCASGELQQETDGNEIFIEMNASYLRSVEYHSQYIRVVWAVIPDGTPVGRSVRITY